MLLTDTSRAKEPKNATTETSRANGGRQISTATRLDHRWNNNSVTGNCTPPIPVIQRPTSALLGRQPRVHSCDKTTKSGISVRGLPRDLLLEGWPALGTSPHYDDVQAVTRDCRPLTSPGTTRTCRQLLCPGSQPKFHGATRFVHYNQEPVLRRCTKQSKN